MAPTIERRLRDLAPGAGDAGGGEHEQQEEEGERARGEGEQREQREPDEPAAGDRDERRQREGEPEPVGEGGGDQRGGGDEREEPPDPDARLAPRLPDRRGVKAAAEAAALITARSRMPASAASG